MALSDHTSYVSSLLEAGNDAFSNLYEVSFTLPESFTGGDTAGSVLTMRCKGFTPPEVSGADPYRVRYLTAFVDWPTAKVNVTRTFDLEFRVDSNYTVYKQLHDLAINNFNPNTEFVDTSLENLEKKTLTVTVNAIKNGSSSAGETDKIKLYEFKYCLVLGVTPLEYKQGTAEPLTAKVSFVFGDMVDLQTSV